MTDMAHDHIPSLTLGWRLRMAAAGLAAQDIARDLGVHRATVARWMADKGAPPRAAYVKQWALITGTNVGWLLTGQQEAPQPSMSDEGLDAVRREGLEPPTRWIRALNRSELAEVLPFERRRRVRPTSRPAIATPEAA